MDIISPTYETRAEGQLVYVLDGLPISWKRVHPGKGSCKPYDEQRHTKMVIGHHVRNQHGDKPMYNGPLHAEFQFFFPIPQNLLKRKDEIASTIYPHRPDLDNLVKLLLDACQGILYENDSCIGSILIQRRYNDGKGLRSQFYFKEIK